jgi:WD40 repeat protein
MWNLDTKEEVWSFRNIDAIINCITVSYDDRLIFTGDTEDTILLFSFESGNLLYSGRRHDNELVNLYIPEGGEYLVSCDKDGQIYIWCIEDFIW